MINRGISSDPRLPLKDLIGSQAAQVGSWEQSTLSRKSLLRRLLIIVMSLEEADERDAGRRKRVDVDILRIAEASDGWQTQREEYCA